MKKVLALVLALTMLVTLGGISIFADGDTSVGTSTEETLLAFPGAEGGGKYTKGARAALDEGGTVEVYHVTTLDSTGEGSFYNAVLADEAADNGESAPVGRIIVFDVGGVINFPTGQ